MTKIFLTKNANHSCHPELVSGSDPNAQWARCRNKFGMTCWIAFTLAEVLITLGIIGVVASLTIPGLVKEYQKKVYETSNLVFENRFGEALRQMNVNDELTGHASTKEFVDALKKYMKIINTCDKTNLTPCFVEKLNDLKVSELEFLGTDDWGTDNIGIVVQNGVIAMIKYNPNCQSPGIAAKGSDLRDCIRITYDTNGMKKPNEPGKDIGGDASFVINMGTFKMTSGDVTYTPVGTNYWQGAVNACKALGSGWRLPNSGVTRNANCPGAAYQKESVSAPASSEACKIGAWCLINGTTCRGTYWVSGAYGAGAGAFVAGSSNTYWLGNTYVTTNNLKVRCVKSP